VQLERGELDAAERSLRGAVEAGPRNAVARVNLAALLSRQGRLEEAAERYREAVALAPGLAPAWRGLGLALTRLERAQEAREALERALALDPGDRRAQTLLRRLDGAPLDDAPPPPR
jgi:Flp pilus assembly protein TadD